MINTKKFAELNDVQPESVRRRYCLTGSYYGIVPEKSVNKRLKWPEKTIHKITKE